MAESGDRGSDLLVIFGITGDLVRKLPFRALYRLERRELLQCPVLGVAGDDISTEELVNRARKAIAETGEAMDDNVFDRLADRLSYLHGDVTDPALYDSLADRVGSKRDCLYYLEMPPSLFAPIVESLGKAGLLEHSRVTVETPFGHDLNSACELNARLHAVLKEDQIFRVDHFMGKQPVVELEYLRFGNLTLAEMWDRHNISEIQITMAEDLGVEDRGKFALPFLPERRQAEPNEIVPRIDPDPGLRVQLTALDGRRWRDVHPDSSFMQDLGEPLTPYERRLHAGLTGDRRLFAHEDSIEETWRIVQPLLDNPGKVHSYETGSWGPEEAQSLLVVITVGNSRGWAAITLHHSKENRKTCS